MNLPISKPSQTLLDHIYDDPNTTHALEIFERSAKRALNANDLATFLDSLPSETIAEQDKIRQLISGQNGNVEADLTSSEKALAWKAALDFVFLNEQPQSIRSHPIWRILTKNRVVQDSLRSASRLVDLSSINRNATMDWGTPGSGFWFSPEKNHINIDLSAILGHGFVQVPGTNSWYAHGTVQMVHEIRHAEWTNRFPDAQAALQKREAELLGAAQKRKLKPEEFLELQRVRVEFQLRHSIFNPAEDATVDDGVLQSRADLPYPLQYSLNLQNVLYQGTGQFMRHRAEIELQIANERAVAANDPKTKTVFEAKQQLDILRKSIVQLFYSQNGLFDPNDMESWKKQGIDPSTLPYFNDLTQLIVGPAGMKYQHPVTTDRWLLRSVFSRSVDSYAERRCRIVDEIWDKYAAPYAQVLIEAAENNAQNQIDQKKQSGQDPASASQVKGTDSQPSGSNQTPSQGGNSQSPTSENTSGGQGSGSIEVEGVGEMNVGGQALPSTPEEARKQARKDLEEGTPSDEAKNIRDLVKEAKDAQHKLDPKYGPSKNKDADQKAEPGSNRADSQSDPTSSQGGNQQGIDLATLATKNWADGRQRLVELESVIARLADDFNDIRKRQRRPVRVQTRQRDDLPRGRIDLDNPAQMRRALKIAANQVQQPHDRRVWKVDETTHEPADIYVWWLVDGSQSMLKQLNDGSGARRIDSAVQSMGAGIFSGRRAGIYSYGAVWGDDEMRLVVEPHSTDQRVFEGLAKVQDGINSGTQLSPAFAQAIERSSRPENPHGLIRPSPYAGTTHFLVLSDGELNNGDISPLVQMMTTLFINVPHASVDIGVLGGSGREMEQVVAQVKTTCPGAGIALIRANNARDIPVSLLRQLKNRLDRAGDIEPIYTEDRLESFAASHRAIKRLGLG